MKLDLDSTCNACIGPDRTNEQLCEECENFLELVYELYGGVMEAGFGIEESSWARQDLFGSDIMRDYQDGTIEIPF